QPDGRLDDDDDDDLGHGADGTARVARRERAEAAHQQASVLGGGGWRGRRGGHGDPALDAGRVQGSPPLYRCGAMERSFVLPLSVAAALALASGCSSTNACKDGTLLVTVTFDSSSGAADSLVIDVTADGDAPRSSTLAHSPGMIDGSVEIDFPTYTAGK